MSFFLFLLVTATLFVRPAEIVQDLEAFPIYEVLILSCLACSPMAVFGQLRWSSLVERPITVCVVGMLPAIFLSHLSHFNLWSARQGTLEFSKVVIFYLLLVANVNSPARLRFFLSWIVGCIVAAAALALLQYYQFVDIPSLSVLQQNDIDPISGEAITIARLRSTGVFNDPNDLSAILVLGMVAVAYFLLDSRSAPIRAVWLAPFVLFGAALLLTKSRGGILALIAALTVLAQSRFGTRKTFWLGAFLLPGLLAIAQGRQADIGGALEEGTGQERIRLWTEAILLLRGSPLFGIGKDGFAEQAGLVAHNSFVHCFAELGFFGGCLFLGAFCIAAKGLYRRASDPPLWSDSQFVRTRPYLLAAVVGYGISLLSLSRAYVVPTYLPLGLATVFVSISAEHRDYTWSRVNANLIGSVCLAGLGFLVAIWLFTKLTVNWS